jgi:glycosyltransferase involved in cell wall biosynthesis
LRGLLFINESKVFGGHEKMFVKLLSGLLSKRKCDISIIADVSNQLFIDEILKLNESLDLQGNPISLITHSFQNLRIRPVTNFIALKDLFFLFSSIKKINPLKVIVIQGTIEISSMSLIVSRLLGKNTLSYLPITKKATFLKVPLSKVRDFLTKNLYYKLPHEIVTISECNKNELISSFNVKSSKIKIVNNFVDVDKTISSIKLKKSVNFAIIGRIDFLQKRQLELCEKLDMANLLDIDFHFVGDSQSKESIELRNSFDSDNIHYHGWKDEKYINSLLRSVDGIIIPSKFEGVPLVMLEALSYGKVVFATDVDGMKDILPENWLFPVDYLSMVNDLLLDYIQNINKYREQAIHFSSDFLSVQNKEKSISQFEHVLYSSLDNQL